MTEHTLKDGGPAVTITSKKYGPVEFRFRSATKGTAYFEPFTLRGVEYKGYLSFRAQPRFKEPENCTLPNEGRGDGKHNPWTCEKTHFKPVDIEHDNSYLRRTAGGMNDRMTDAAREEVEGFVIAEAAALFENGGLVKLAHAGEIGRMLEREKAEIDALDVKLAGMRGRLYERQQQEKGGAPFCLVEARNGYREACMLPIGHSGDHDYARR